VNGFLSANIFSNTKSFKTNFEIIQVFQELFSHVYHCIPQGATSSILLLLIQGNFLGHYVNLHKWQKEIHLEILTKNRKNLLWAQETCHYQKINSIYAITISWYSSRAITMSWVFETCIPYPLFFFLKKLDQNTPTSPSPSSTHPSQTLDLPFIDDMDVFIEDLATAWFVITVIDGFAPMGR